MKKSESYSRRAAVREVVTHHHSQEERSPTAGEASYLKPGD
jgi:hypothetical protein